MLISRNFVCRIPRSIIPSYRETFSDHLIRALVQRYSFRIRPSIRSAAHWFSANPRRAMQIFAGRSSGLVHTSSLRLCSVSFLPYPPASFTPTYLLGHVVMDTGLQKRSWNEGKEKRPNICRSTSVPRTLISFFSGQDSDTGRSQTDPSSPSPSLNERVANRRKK